eukprot:6209369-Pleurochrysis_carterae.AAC.4
MRHSFPDSAGSWIEAGASERKLRAGGKFVRNPWEVVKREDLREGDIRYRTEDVRFSRHVEAQQARLVVESDSNCAEKQNALKARLYGEVGRVRAVEIELQRIQREYMQKGAEAQPHRQTQRATILHEQAKKWSHCVRSRVSARARARAW